MTLVAVVNTLLLETKLFREATHTLNYVTRFRRNQLPLSNYMSRRW